MGHDDGISVLVADDDPDILSYFRAIIKDPRYQLHLVPDGLQAVEAARKQRMDVAFVDVNMPRLDGIQTLVKLLEVRPETKVIMMSSYSDGDLVRQAIDKGAYTYLFKPLNKRDIFSVFVKSLKEAGFSNLLTL